MLTKLKKGPHFTKTSSFRLFEKCASEIRKREEEEGGRGAAPRNGKDTNRSKGKDSIRLFPSCFPFPLLSAFYSFFTCPCCCCCWRFTPGTCVFLRLFFMEQGGGWVEAGKHLHTRAAPFLKKKVVVLFSVCCFSSSRFARLATLKGVGRYEKASARFGF